MRNLNLDSVEIERAVAYSARRLSLAEDEAEDLASHVHLRLLEDDQHILRAFEGKSKLSTYLTTVVMNLARDYRIKKWGKWRPSAAAKRMGTVGVQLDTLLHRDGYSLREATEILRSRFDVELSALEVADLAAKLPVRGRRWFEGEEAIAGMASDERADQGVRDAERADVLETAGGALQAVLGELDPEERLILKLRFMEGATVAAIARSFGVEQRPLYTRIYNALAKLRAALEAAGVDGEAVMEATGWGEGELGLDFGEGGEAELVESVGPRPSQEDEGRPQEAES